MIAFRRLSSGPTIPELMQTEQAVWLAQAHSALSALTWNRLITRGRMQACLLGATLILAAARVFLRSRLIEPAVAASAFQAASRLSRAGMTFWRHSRRTKSDVRSRPYTRQEHT